jgi:hypothetical protein
MPRIMSNDTIPRHQTQSFPLKAILVDESTKEHPIEIIDNIFKSQLQHDDKGPKWENKLRIMIGGLKTINLVLSCKQLNNFRRYDTQFADLCQQPLCVLHHLYRQQAFLLRYATDQSGQLNSRSGLAPLQLNSDIVSLRILAPRTTLFHSVCICTALLRLGCCSPVRYITLGYKSAKSIARNSRFLFLNQVIF